MSALAAKEQLLDVCASPLGLPKDAEEACKHASGQRLQLDTSRRQPSPRLQHCSCSLLEKPCMCHSIPSSRSGLQLAPLGQTVQS